MDSLAAVRRLRILGLLVATFAARTIDGQSLVLNEFVAFNENGLKDENGTDLGCESYPSCP